MVYKRVRDKTSGQSLPISNFFSTPSGVPGLVPVVSPGIKFASTQLYTWVEGGIVREKRLAQEHNTLLTGLESSAVTMRPNAFTS